MSRSDDIHHISSYQLDVPTGITNAIFISQEAEQVSMTMKWVSGSSLLIFGVTLGLTLAPTDIMSGYSNLQYYPVAPNEIINIDGPAVFYLATPGVTTRVAFLKGKSSH